MAVYEPPIHFGHHVPTREGARPPPDARSDWIPYATDIPEGRSPQAVRVIRQGEQPVTLRLLTTQTYKVGRNSDCQLQFSDTCVSRLHGLLYFVPELSGWAYRDPLSTRGSFIYRAGESTKKAQVDRSTPIGIVAGQILELCDSLNRLEFLEAVPTEVAGTAAQGRWRSNAARKLEESVQDAARKSGPVLLFGPSGSGKTYLAQLIHELSGRKGPYVELNCGRLPRDPNQLQSELLGHVKGAYTGATFRRVGALFEADHGTLFLDEVESLPAEAQVFLLDVLEGTSPLRPLGADKGLPRPNVRFICSTKVPLDDTTLREDLVNRLVRGHRIIIPTLAERREDVPLLVGNILDVIKAASGVEATVTQEAMEFLTAQEWPGHVRQLKAALDSTTDGHHGGHLELGVKAFQDYVASEAIVRGGSTAALVDTTNELEPETGPIEIDPPEGARKRPIDMTRADVEDALRRAGGVMKVAAELLGCSPTTLREKRKEFGL